jgi:hypothetical protein
MTPAHMIIDSGDGTYGVVEVDLDDPNHEELQNYQHDDVLGSYDTVTDAALGFTFGVNGFKVHPELQGKV